MLEKKLLNLSKYKNPLKRHRLLYSLSQSEAAKCLGVSIRTYQRYESESLPKKIPESIKILIMLGAFKENFNNVKTKIDEWNRN